MSHNLSQDSMPQGSIDQDDEKELETPHSEIFNEKRTLMKNASHPSLKTAKNGPVIKS